MKIFSIQPRVVYDILCRDGIFLSQPQYAVGETTCTDSPTAQLSYGWLCDQMVRRGLARPSDDIFPIWAWHRYLGSHRAKPDLRYADIKNYSRDGRKVLLSIDIPDTQVLLHDYYAWHYPLNYWYLAARREDKRFEQRCKMAGCPLYADAPLTSDALHAELVASWETIFDLAKCRRLLRMKVSTQPVQATFWSLNANFVTEAVEFGSGAPRLSLPLPGR